MSRELWSSDPVSSVDRSSSEVLDEQPADQSHHESLSTPSASDTAPSAAEPNRIDEPVIDRPSSVDDESSSLRCEEETSSRVRMLQNCDVYGIICVERACQFQVMLEDRLEVHMHNVHLYFQALHITALSLTEIKNVLTLFIG